MRRNERQLRAALAANAGWRGCLELALMPRLFYTCAAVIMVDSRRGPGEEAWFHSVAPALRTAIHEALGPQIAARGRLGVTRLDLLACINLHLLRPYEARPRALVISTLVHLVNRLHQDGILLLPEEGAVLDALLAFIEAMNAYPDITEGVDGSAAKNARRMLAACRDLGLYLPVAGEVAA